MAFCLRSAQGATKEQICTAIWSESESEDIKKLIGVNLSLIKKDLACLGMENALICREKRYSICRDEIEWDIDLYEKAAENFRRQKSDAEAQKLLFGFKRGNTCPISKRFGQWGKEKISETLRKP